MLAQSHFYEYVTRSMKCHAIFTTQWLAMVIAISSYVGKLAALVLYIRGFLFLLCFRWCNGVTCHARAIESMKGRGVHISMIYASGLNRARISIRFYSVHVNRVNCTQIETGIKSTSTIRSVAFLCESSLLYIHCILWRQKNDWFTREIVLSFVSCIIQFSTIRFKSIFSYHDVNIIELSSR